MGNMGTAGMSFRKRPRKGLAPGRKRQSIMKFVRGEQSLRLDIADRLAAHFKIESRRMRERAVRKHDKPH